MLIYILHTVGTDGTMPYEMQLANLFMISCNFLQNIMCYCMYVYIYIYIYIYIYSVQGLAVMEMFS